MSSSHRLARSLAVASSAILLVTSGAFAHDQTFADAPSGAASSPATWQEDDDRQATDFLNGQQGDEVAQGDDAAQGNEDDQAAADEAAHHREQSGQEHHAVATKPTKTASASGDENDDDQGEDADENDGADEHDGDNGDQGEHDNGDQGEHDGGDGGGGD
jgi:hypothetical protein